MKTGVPAFPGFDTKSETFVPGMDLVDHFAGQALAGKLAAWTNRETRLDIASHASNAGITAEQYIAMKCYDFAEAMIAEREKRLARKEAV